MESAYWLRYDLTGVLGQRDPLERLARAITTIAEPRELVRVVELDRADLHLVPVVPALATQLHTVDLCACGFDDDSEGHGVEQRIDLLTGPESGFDVLTLGLAMLAGAASSSGRLAYVEADYMGLEGRQAAAVWEFGRLSKGPLLLGRQERFESTTAPISVALRTLGVRRSSRGAFLAAGLDRHRRTSEWLGMDGQTEGRRWTW